MHRAGVDMQEANAILESNAMALFGITTQASGAPAGHQDAVKDADVPGRAPPAPDMTRWLLGEVRQIDDRAVTAPGADARAATVALPDVMLSPVHIP